MCWSFASVPILPVVSSTLRDLNDASRLNSSNKHYHSKRPTMTLSIYTFSTDQSVLMGEGAKYEITINFLQDFAVSYIL